MGATTSVVLTGCLAPEAGAITGCLTPIDRDGLQKLIEAGKANPKVIKTLKCKTVAEGRFRHLNFIRSLEPYIVDEPPGLLGDDTAPNPSEATLAALGSCLAVGLHANAVHRGWTVRKLELELEGDLNCQRRSKFTSICRSDSAAFWLAGSHSMRLACWRGVHSVGTGPDSGSTLGRRVWRLL
jgi:uncharacterized OsmC-like protein